MILSIESSCDDSGIAITKIDNKKLIFHKKISQDEEHSMYGGVVPELAARLHAIALPKILNETKEYFNELKAVAVTNEPGLSVTLIEGVTMAKSLSVSLGIPILPINHLKGHIYSLFIEKEAIFPLFVLLVSGGHTQILHMENYDDIKVLGNTKDDSFGESFDKVAKMLSLGYPGGPIVEKYARQGDSKRFSFTTPLLQTKEIAFSYSGLKNQTRLAINMLGKLKQKDRYDICASFQEVAIEHIINKTERVFKQNSIKNFAVVGGASANKILKDKLEKICTKYGATFLTASLKFCSDNAAMIGRCALEAYNLKRFVSFENIEINPRSKL